MRETILYNESMEGISISRIRRDPGFTMEHTHLHEEYEIYYLTQGERYYFIDQKTYHIQAGCLVLIDRSQIHLTSQAGQGSHERILLSLEEEALAQFFAFTGEVSLSAFFQQCRGVISFPPEDARLAESLFSRIAKELAEKDAGYRQVVFSCLSCLFIQVLRRSASIPPSPFLAATKRHQTADQVAAYISANHTQPMSLETIARHFFMNKSYLGRIFREATGFTINEYINLCRIQKARRLLLSTADSITEIAELSGYDSITYFERIFRKYAGMSPLKYRKQYQPKTTPVQ